METKLLFITLGVANLAKSVSFYHDGLGWPTGGIVGQDYHDDETGADGEIAFFKFDNGILLALYQRSNLAKDAQISLDKSSSVEFSLGYPAKSKAEVDKILGLAEAAGGTVTAAPHLRPWEIYSGYFKDPDGHLWEVVYKTKP